MLLMHRFGTGMKCTVLTARSTNTCLPKEGKHFEIHHSRRPQHILLQFSKFTITVTEKQTNRKFWIHRYFTSQIPKINKFEAMMLTCRQVSLKYDQNKWQEKYTVWGDWRWLKKKGTLQSMWWRVSNNRHNARQQGRRKQYCPRSQERFISVTDMFSFACTSSMYVHIWSWRAQPGLPGWRRTRSCWRRSRGGQWIWCQDWRLSLMRKSWRSWAWLPWRRGATRRTWPKCIRTWRRRTWWKVIHGFSQWTMQKGTHGAQRIR